MRRTNLTSLVSARTTVIVLDPPVGKFPSERRRRRYASSSLFMKVTKTIKTASAGPYSVHTRRVLNARLVPCPEPRLGRCLTSHFLVQRASSAMGK